MTLSRGHRVLFGLSFVTVLGTATTLVTLNRALQNKTATHGVVSMELARTLSRLQNVLASWGQPERIILAFSIGLAFCCTAAFTATLALGCSYFAHRFRGWFALNANVGQWVTATVWIVGALWMVQDALLGLALFGYASDPTVSATWCLALLKFAAVTVGIMYITCSALFLIWRRFRHS